MASSGPADSSNARSLPICPSRAATVAAGERVANDSASSAYKGASWVMPSHALASPSIAWRNAGSPLAAETYSPTRSRQASLTSAGTSAGAASNTEPPPTNGSMKRPVSRGAPATIAGNSCVLPPGHFRNGLSRGYASSRGGANIDGGRVSAIKFAVFRGALGRWTARGAAEGRMTCRLSRFLPSQAVSHVAIGWKHRKGPRVRRAGSSFSDTHGPGDTLWRRQKA